MAALWRRSWEADPRQPGPLQQRIETPLQEVGGVERAAPLAIATVTGTLVVASAARARHLARL